VPVFFVASTASIDEMAEYLPQNLDELVKINGFGKAKAKQYGKMFLDTIAAYCEKHHLASAMHTKKFKKEKKENKNA